MSKIKIVLSSVLLLLFSLSGYAQNVTVSKSKMIMVKPRVIYADNVLTISNETAKPINLSNAELKFYYQGKIENLSGLNKLKFKPQIQVKHFGNLPNQPGSAYTVRLTEVNRSQLLPGQTIQLKIATDGNDKPSGFKLFALDLPAVQVKVTVLAPNWTQTIQVCNNTANNIPLKNVEFEFNFNGNISSFWGNPWMAWTVANHEGNKYVLRGGTQWTPDLTSDPNCLHPMTIQFSSSPTTPAPTGPFTFRAEGGVPASVGSMTVTAPAAPTTGLPNPRVTVQGMGTTQNAVLSWGQVWQLNNLIPGNYTVNASRVDNGTNYYLSPSITVAVQGSATTPVNLTYQPVQTGNVAVSLVNAPAQQEPVTFTGQFYTFTKQASSGNSFVFPSDTYTVTSSVPGYSVSVSPNPLMVPQNNAVTLTYQQSSQLPIFGGYFESWKSKWASDPSKTEIANLPSYVNYVYLAFIRPDSNYQKGSLNYLAAGLEMNYESGAVLKQAIALLHQKNPNTKVLISVGGASYNNWAGFNPQAVADFVKDFGLDGADIDYEAPNPGCSKGSSGLITCQIDSTYQSIIQSMRAALPRPYLVTVASWSIAAYGQDQWSNSQPQGDYTGMMLPFFRSAAAKDLDLVNVMSYDASNAYNPIEALAAYSNYYPGPIAMGVEVPPEGWGGHVYTLSEVHQLAQAVLSSAPQHNTPPGMMIWSLQKQPNGTPSPSNPNAQMMATTICNDFGLLNCNELIIK